MRNLPRGDDIIAALSGLGLLGQLSQHDRLLQLQTSTLPPGALIPEVARIDEAINVNFQIELDAITLDSGLPVGQLLGQEITLHLLLADGMRRPCIPRSASR